MCLYIHVGECVKLLSSVRLFETPWTVAPCPWDSPGKNIGVGCHFLLQGIFPTQGSNPGLLHCRQTLYPLSHQGSPVYIYIGMFFLLYPNIEVQMTSMTLCSEKCENNWFGINKVTDI